MPLRVSPEGSLQEHHSPIYATTSQPNYGASYYGPGAYLQEPPIFLNPSLLRTVYGITVTIVLELIYATTSNLRFVSLVTICLLSFFAFTLLGPGQYRAMPLNRSITRRKSPRASFPHLRYYKLTLQPNYGASYYGPGAYLQEHYTPIFLNPPLLRTVYGITVTIYFALIVQTVSVFPSPTSIAMLTT